MSTPTINQAPEPVPLPVVSFSWSPQTTAFTYTANGQTYGGAYQGNPAALHTAHATPITFTAKAYIPASLPNSGISGSGASSPANAASIVSYSWDFGDGTSGTGQVVLHTFAIANPTLRVSLAVLDSLNRVTAIGRQLNLV